MCAAPKAAPPPPTSNVPPLPTTSDYSNDAAATAAATPPTRLHASAAPSTDKPSRSTAGGTACTDAGIGRGNAATHRSSSAATTTSAAATTLAASATTTRRATPVAVIPTSTACHTAPSTTASPGTTGDAPPAPRHADSATRAVREGPNDNSLRRRTSHDHNYASPASADTPHMSAYSDDIAAPPTPRRSIPIAADAGLTNFASGPPGHHQHAPGLDTARPRRLLHRRVQRRSERWGRGHAPRLRPVQDAGRGGRFPQDPP